MENLPKQTKLNKGDYVDKKGGHVYKEQRLYEKLKVPVMKLTKNPINHIRN